MLREVPNAWLQVTIVSGLLMSKFRRSLIVKIRKTAPGHQKLAEVLQIIRQMIFPLSIQTNVRISFA
jgi:hypothetical protein